MMELKINREALIKPLMQVAGVVERRQTLPVLSNVLLRVHGNTLSLTGTDLEVQMFANVAAKSTKSGETTVAARKFLDICKELPEGADIDLGIDRHKLTIKSGRFRSTLATLPAQEFPLVDTSAEELKISLEGQQLKRLLDRTSFAMAQQDVRYFLNGLLIEVGDNQVKVVATDGHRLAMCHLQKAGLEGKKQIIVPRKGIMELQRLLSDESGEVVMTIGSNHLCVETGAFKLTTKLIDGRFPDYERVIPPDGDKTVLADKIELRQALNRTAILSNEKFRGIRVILSDGLVQLSANNPEQEEAEEEVSVDYQGPGLEIGFNVGYLLDVLGVITNDKVKITLSDANASAVLEEPEEEDSIYVVMPMKL